MTDFNEIRFFKKGKKRGAVSEQSGLLRQRQIGTFHAVCPEEQFNPWFAGDSQARRDYVEGNISGQEMLARVRLD